MARYKRAEARDWAREHLKGVANVTLPTMTADFKSLNEKAIRHDMELSITHGFVGTLACSEVAITMAEYQQLCEIMVDQAKSRTIVFHHAVFNTLEDNIEAMQGAERAGAEMVLLGYPPYFSPTSLEEIYVYTKAMCDATNLGVMLFPISTWGFNHLHPADMPLELLRRLVDDCPNVVSIKAEGGRPYIMATIEDYREFGNEIVISSPLDWEYIPLAQLMDIPFSGTNHTAYYGPLMPRVHKLLQARDFKAATQIFYQMEPARRAKSSLAGSSAGLINRMMWKYEGWLQGYNGGPLRHPTPRIYRKDMAVLRAAQQKSGLEPTATPDNEFFAGRNPA